MHIMFMYAYIIFCRCKSMTMRSQRNLFHHHSWRARFSLARHYNLTTIFMFKVAVHFELSYCISLYILLGCAKEPRVELVCNESHRTISNHDPSFIPSRNCRPSRPSRADVPARTCGRCWPRRSPRSRSASSSSVRTSATSKSAKSPSTW